ncbi:MAG: efflux RND transporter periplasmic adaptor subunit [Chloroflexi bacterium]|nr:efflux RND transporter periplasmic adaptor subunit [Chloroflexota bacterium]
MHPNPRRVIPVILLVAIAGLAYWWFNGRASAQTNELQASGTIETTEYIIAPEIAGRVIEVTADEGDAVTAGQTLVSLDASLLRAQRAQAEAALAAANNAVSAAKAAAQAAAANVALLESGPTVEQLAVAQTVVDKAQLAVDALQETYDDLSEAAQDSASGKSLKQQLDQAKATLANAQAQYDLMKAGANPKQIEAVKAQAEAAQAQAGAAQAQADAAQAALAVLDVQIGRLTITAPADGVVLSRAVEPGSVVLPGATMLVVADLSQLQITVYAPEDRYGGIKLGQTATVTVDSFPNDSFTATVVHIADKAEFTPRNVQTAEGRKTTVFAVKLSIDNPEGKLKPGLPADVAFGK